MDDKFTLEQLDEAVMAAVDQIKKDHEDENGTALFIFSSLAFAGLVRSKLTKIMEDD